VVFPRRQFLNNFAAFLASFFLTKSPYKSDFGPSICYRLGSKEMVADGTGEIAIMNPIVGRDNTRYEESKDGRKPFLPLIKIIGESGKVTRKFEEGILFKVKYQQDH
jgi:hypothetical protein